MKKINLKNLIEKSRNIRNEEQIIKLANRDSLIEWAKTENPEILPSSKIVIKRNSVGWLNFTKTLLFNLRP